jgi:outer membrane protein TolC
MKTAWISLMLLIFTWMGSAQTITLDSCQSLARQNHPLLVQAGLIDHISELRQSNLSVSNLPQFDLTARASWQSDVTRVSLGIPGVQGPKPLPKDQYKVYVEMRQKLYDGGITKSRKLLEEAERKISRQQLETELFKIRESVNSLYFNVLLLDQNLRIVSLKKEVIDKKLDQVSSAVANGVALPNDLDQLKAELLVTHQQEIDLESVRETNLNLLGIIVGVDLGELELVVPDEVLSLAGQGVNRPEIALFNLQKEKLETSSSLLQRSRFPNVFAFGQAGYGQPGLNMLNPDFADWVMVGVGLSWNIWDWSKTRRDRQAVQHQKAMVDANSSQFERALKMASNEETAKLSRYELLIANDLQVVDLKEQIVKRSESAFANGTITSADYLRDLNAMLQSRWSLEAHKLQRVQAMVNYLTIQGNF